MTDSSSSKSDIAALQATLIDDVVKAWHALSASKGSQYDRRGFVRAAFAYIEGVTFVLKHEALKAHEADCAKYSAGEVALLREVSYELSEQGTVYEKQRFPAFLPNVSFGLLSFARQFDPSFQLDKESDGWDHFRKAVGVRNRVTHPKSDVSLVIPDEDLQTVARAFLWFRGAVDSVMAKAREYLAALREIQAELEKLSQELEGMKTSLDHIGT